MFRSALTTLLFALSLPAYAQQPSKTPRVGFVSGDGSRSAPGPQVEAFERGLGYLGYVKGKNIFIEYRYVEGKSDRIPNLVAELVKLKVDVLFARAQLAIRAAKRATKEIPIVMVTTQDPVASGFVNSLARPGGNITGITTLQRELSGKRLELLRDILPGLTRVGILSVKGKGIMITSGTKRGARTETSAPISESKRCV